MIRVINRNKPLETRKEHQEEILHELHEMVEGQWSKDGVPPKHTFFNQVFTNVMMVIITIMFLSVLLINLWADL